MYIQLVEKSRNFKSPILYIHSDEEEALEFIKKWRKDLLDWAKTFTKGAMPLGRCDANTAMCDLVHKLGNYYLKSMPDEIRLAGRIQSWLRLFNEDEVGKGEETVTINLFE